jgi:hypothetical protein
MSENHAFEIVEAATAIPKTTKRVDGFSRQDVVNAFQHAFTMIGGVQRLALWANANPDKFFPLYAKLMPSTSINFGDNASVQVIHAIAPTALDRHPAQPAFTQDSAGEAEFVHVAAPAADQQGA